MTPVYLNIIQLTVIKKNTYLEKKKKASRVTPICHTHFFSTSITCKGIRFSHRQAETVPKRRKILKNSVGESSLLQVLVGLALHATTWMEVLFVLFVSFPVLTLAPGFLLRVQVLQHHFLSVVRDHALLPGRE